MIELIICIVIVIVSGMLVDSFVKKKQVSPTITILLGQLVILFASVLAPGYKNVLRNEDGLHMNYFYLAVISNLLCAIPFAVLVEKTKNEKNKQTENCFGTAFAIFITSTLVFMGMQVLFQNYLRY